MEKKKIEQLKKLDRIAMICEFIAIVVLGLGLLLTIYSTSISEVSMIDWISYLAILPLPFYLLLKRKDNVYLITAKGGY